MIADGYLDTGVRAEGTLEAMDAFRKAKEALAAEEGKHEGR